MTLWTDMAGIAPLLVVAGTAAIVLLLSVAGGITHRSLGGVAHLVLVSLGGIALAAALLFAREGSSEAFTGAMRIDGVSSAFGAVALLSAALAIAFAIAHLREHGMAPGEYLALVLLSTSGMLILTMAGDLIALFIGLEVMSLAAYVLAGYRRSSARSQEAALKYFVYGAFASAFLLFGAALLYGEVGRVSGTPGLHFRALALAFTPDAGISLLGWIGVAMVLSGLCFKVAAVPFHMWAPDVYEGAPTPAAGFLAVGIKAAAFAGICRFAAAVFVPDRAPANETVIQIFEVLAVLTMVIGNLVAARQRQVKRLLAYSSVAHAGYLFVGIAAFVAKPDGEALTGIVFYLIAYAAMTLGAFGVLIAFERKEDREPDFPLERLAGAAHRYPALGLCMAVFMFSLAGVPPTAGFFGKLSLFSAALNADRVSVVILAVLASVVGAYYYLRVLVVMYMQGDDREQRRVRSPWLNTALWACAGLTLVLGMWPEPVLGWAKAAVGSVWG